MEAPPLLVLFPDINRLFDAVHTDVSRDAREQIESLSKRGLPPAISIRILGVLFGLRPQFIGAMRANPTRYYRTFTIKTGKKQRRIDAPRVALKLIQKWFGHHFSRSISLPENIVGFVPGRSAIEGAGMHCGADWVFSTDIENFFQSTPERLIIEALEDHGYSYDAAQLIASLSCLGGVLAQGSPASPVLSNIAMASTDKKLIEYAGEINAIFTRYADDIVFSGQGVPPSNIVEIISSTFNETPWRLSKEKTKSVCKPARLKVYGLVVNGDAPRLTKGYRKRIRAIKHRFTSEPEKQQTDFKSRGHLAYSDSVSRWKPKNAKNIGN
jgi:RNA-directed DNA polymerase